MRKVSLSMVALALVALFGFAANKPAHAFQLNGCTTIYVEGYALTAKVVDPGTLQNTTVFTEGCQIGVALTHGGQTVKNVTVIGQGLNSVTLADILITGSSSSTITNVNLTGAQVGVFVDYSTTTITNATITGMQLGIFADAGYQGKITLKSSNLFDNLIGADLYRTHITSSGNNYHENYIGGLFNWGGSGSSTYDTFYGNQGVGDDTEDGSFSLNYANVSNNGYGAPCSISGIDITCMGSYVYVNILGFTEFFFIDDLDQTTNGFYAGVEAYDASVTLNHTNVTFNAVGIAAFSYSHITIKNLSVVCNNHNSADGNTNIVTDSYATVTTSGSNHICF